MKKLLLISALTVLIHSTLQLSGETVKIQIGERGVLDTWVANNDTPILSDRLQASYVRRPDGFVIEHRILIAFTDLSQIPTKAQIISAKLALFRYDGFHKDPTTLGTILSVCPIIQTWFENVTWNQQPLIAPPISEATVIGNGWYSWDITTLVQQWVVTPSANNGVCLLNDGVFQRFVSSDNSDMEQHPYLEVTYELESQDNQPPKISGCPADIVVANDPGLCGATVTWTAPTASDNVEVVSFDSNHAPGESFPVGTTVVTYIAKDAVGNSTECSFNVTVEDREAPVIKNLSATPTSLKPANHKLVLITLNYTVSDNCGRVTRSLSATSNEPDNGTGDGDQAKDIQFIPASAHSLYVRAERAGNGKGRVYTIVITCTDAHNNVATQKVLVTVPHDQGK
jgi:hypothetical protein